MRGEAETTEEARAEGDRDQLAGRRPSENPYADGPVDLCRAWAEGYRESYLRGGQRGQPV